MIASSKILFCFVHWNLFRWDEHGSSAVLVIVFTISKFALCVFGGVDVILSWQTEKGGWVWSHDLAGSTLSTPKNTHKYCFIILPVSFPVSAEFKEAYNSSFSWLLPQYFYHPLNHNTLPPPLPRATHFTWQGFRSGVRVSCKAGLVTKQNSLFPPVFPPVFP